MSPTDNYLIPGEKMNNLRLDWGILKEFKEKALPKSD